MGTIETGNRNRISTVMGNQNKRTREPIMMIRNIVRIITELFLVTPMEQVTTTKQETIVTILELFLVTPMEQVTTTKRETTVTISEIVTPETCSKWHRPLFRVGILCEHGELEPNVEHWTRDSAADAMGNHTAWSSLCNTPIES